MIQLWYPADAVGGYPRAPYMTPPTARAYEKLTGPSRLNWPITHAYLGAPVHTRGGGWPVVLYSHSLGGERFETTSLVEDLASHGYVVVTIDHVHDADVVVLPDGRVASCAVPEPTADADTPATTKEIVSRVADVRFVLDQLAVINGGGNPDPDHPPLPHGLRGALDLSRVGMFGQSDGGSTTAPRHARRRAHQRRRQPGRHPLDAAGRGRLRPPAPAVREAGPGPLRGGYLGGVLEDTARPEALAQPPGLHACHLHRLRRPAAAGRSHPPKPPSWVIEGIGTINGQRAVAVERTYIGAYFDRYLRHHDSPLLAGPSPCYPEVLFAS